MLDKIYGAVVILCIFLLPGFVEGEMYLTSAAMIAFLVIVAVIENRREKNHRK